VRSAEVSCEGKAEEEEEEKPRQRNILEVVVVVREQHQRQYTPHLSYTRHDTTLFFFI